MGRVAPAKADTMATTRSRAPPWARNLNNVPTPNRERKFLDELREPLAVPSCWALRKKSRDLLLRCRQAACVKARRVRLRFHSRLNRLKIEKMIRSTLL